MMNYKKILRLEEKKEGADGGGSGGDKAPGSQAPPATPPATGAAPPKEEGDTHDDFGYEKTPEPKGEKDAAGKDAVKPKSEKKEPEEIPNPATGYGKEPPKVEDPPAEPPKDDKIELGYELKVDGLDAKEIRELKEIAKAEGLTQKQAQSLVDREQRKAKAASDAQVQADKQVEIERNRTRATWHKELVDDPTFGGDKFAHNVHQAEKVVSEFMPLTKKVLTERKSMLPPYVMRDLAKLADHLFGGDNLVQGDKASPPKIEKEKDDALDFYE